MNYHLRSFKTKSYWIYVICSIDSLKTFVAVVGGAWMTIDILDSFNYLIKKKLSPYCLPVLLLSGVLSVIFSRRPLRRITYKYPGQDLTIEVCIGNIFDIPGQKIISTNTTFDTDTSNGIISLNSLQGQFTEKYFPGELQKLDGELDRGLIDIPSKPGKKKPGKNRSFDFGTTVKIKLLDQYFYWFAMADLNSSNTAITTLRNVNASLEGLWSFISTKGEKLDTVIPLIGTGLGRLTTSRKKIIAIIAQSFISASEDQIFANKLTIVVHPSDIEKSGLNLFEVKDLLHHYLP